MNELGNTASVRIPLAMSGMMKWFYLIVIGISLLMALGSLGILGQQLNLWQLDEGYDATKTENGEKESSAKDLVISVIGVIFFGGGSIFILKLIRKQAGYLEISPEGVLLDTYITIGFIPWNNLAAVGPVRALGVKYLGFQVKNLPRYIESRKSLPTKTRSQDLATAQYIMRVLMLTKNLVPDMILNLILAMFGLSKLPESSKEEDLLEWNNSNYNYHLLLHGFWFKNLEDTSQSILRQRPAVIAATPEPVEAPASPIPADPSGFKKCPMCAEMVRAEAKICRFCRYTFPEEG